MQEHNTKSNNVDEYAQIRKILEDADNFFEKHPRDSLVVKLPKDSEHFRETLRYIASMKYGFLVLNTCLSKRRVRIFRREYVPPFACGM